MNKFEQSREAAKITFDKVSSWEELNAATLQEADKNFNKKIEETWKEFAVSGVLQFDKKEGKQILQPFTDLDGRSALGILKESGIDISNLTYVRPGESMKGAINLDTGDRFGVVYEESTYTAYFDHHAKGTKEVTSTAEIVYKTMAELGKLEKSEAIDRLVDFVTKIDNRQFPPEEFLKSAKTILGLQRDLDFGKLLAYFKEHGSPTEELAPEEFEKYGLKDSAEKQQKTVDEAMRTLGRMEEEGKVIDTKYGKIVVNENNELKVGTSAAYVKFDGIINFTPGKSFAITLKEKDFNEEELRNKLGEKFQGKIIRGKMWLYNETGLLKLSLEEIIDAITSEKLNRCEYCGKVVGHVHSCDGISGNVGFETEKEDYKIETITDSDNLIIEYVNKYDSDSKGYLINKIEFIDKKGDIVDISSFIPNGIKLIRDRYGYRKQGDNFHFNSEKKFISYCNLKKKGRLFAFLHEVGHAIDHCENKKLKRSDFYALRDNPVFKFLLINRAAYKIASQERNAWFYALKLVRQCAKKGIAIEPGLDYLEFIKKALQAYNNQLLEESGKDNFNKKVRKKFKVE